MRPESYNPENYNREKALLPSVRPEAREGQVLDIAEIVPGAVFGRFYGDSRSKRSYYTVLGLPQERKPGEYWVRVRKVFAGVNHPGGEYSPEYDISLADSGVVPYVDYKGNVVGWNPTNYLVKVSDAPRGRFP